MIDSLKEAARHNASRMTDEQLDQEIRKVSGFTEQPPVRVEYIAVLHEERDRRRQAANSQVGPDAPR